MEKLILALGPAFATGFALQQFLEILDPVLDKIIGTANKKVVLGILSFILGLSTSFGIGLRVLQPLQPAGAANFNPFADAIVTGLIISAGTEGFNSIMKFLGYIKEERKVVVQEKREEVIARGDR